MTINSNTKRVALVTGGSRGIGLGIAKKLAKADFRVIINGRRPADAVGDVLDELNKLGADALYCQADIGELVEHAPLIDRIQRFAGRLDVLVNNAGVGPLDRCDLLEATPESFDRLLRINLRGPYFLTQKIAHWMIQQRQVDEQFQAAIINISSISAVTASVNRGDYCISKAGVVMASKLWATRLGEFGIPVYEVRPGIIRTDMTSAVVDKYDELLANGLTVDARWGEPEDVGKAVAMLASGTLSYATGTVLPIDGGLTINRL